MKRKKSFRQYHKKELPVGSVPDRKLFSVSKMKELTYGQLFLRVICYCVALRALQ